MPALRVQIPQVHVKPGQKQEHQGIKVELIGRVETMTDGTKKYAGLLAGKAPARPRAAACAVTFGGAVWDAFRENANCGNPVGNLWVTCG